MMRLSRFPLRMSGLALLALSPFLAGCESGVASAQQGASEEESPPVSAPQPRTEMAGEGLDLVFEREVFNYPDYPRRNPFAPLSGGEGGPRFEELELRMVILSDEPGQSVATLMERTPGARGRAAGPERTYRVRVGDRLGNLRVLAIRLREIDVEVDDFGSRERRTMGLQRTAPEAEPGDSVPASPPIPPDSVGFTPIEGLGDTE
jgi:hypothetical protein